MEFGADFDDDFFEQPTQRQLNGPSNYEPRVIQPFWFMEADVKGSSESLVALKHRADHLYVSKSYPKAAEAYERCLELAPPANGTWRREFMENLARVNLKMDRPEKALEWSFKLDKLSCNSDQKVVSMNLLATVCHRLGKYAEELEALHCCLEAHKLCPQFWQRLALCYAGLFKLSLPEYPLSPTEEPEEEACCDFKAKKSLHRSMKNDSGAPTDSSQVCPADSTAAESVKCELCTLGIQIVSSCLIRTRMLIDSTGPSQLTSQRDDHLKEKIANSLKHMEVNQDFIDVASQMLGGEFSSILQRPDSSTLEQHSLINHKEQDSTKDS